MDIYETLRILAEEPEKVDELISKSNSLPKPETKHVVLVDKESVEMMLKESNIMVKEN